MNTVDPMLPTGDLEQLPPEEVVDRLVEQAAQLQASDLLMASNQENVGVWIRHLGIMKPLARLPVDLGHRCISHLKVMAGMNMVEHRRPLDGRWLHQRADGRRVDLRINTIPTLFGEDCTLRLLGCEPQFLRLEELGFIQKELNDLLGMLNSPSGLLLVTGPTGSGKTTTLYACLRYLNNGQRKINTIEDPVESELHGVRQSQINPKIDLDFPELLRSVLRQAPDVIMIGEIRDAVTAATAVRAANSGHLVLATLHAPIAAGAVQSLRAWGVHSHFLASSLLGVIAQRLLRTLCPECRMEFPLASPWPTFEDVKPWLADGQGRTLTAARGCAACHGTGYRGRTGVFEIWRISPGIRRLIADGATTSALRAQAVREGFIELRQAALLKVAQGATTAEEIVRVVPLEFLGLED